MVENMGKTVRITGGRVLTPSGFRDTDLCIRDGVIQSLDASTPADETVDAAGLTVLPGFIDIHTHGGAGVDVNAASSEDLRKIGAFFASQGVTGWLCSILTDTPEQTIWCIRQAKEVIRHPGGGARLLGIHLEGPCLSPEYKGAMPEHLLMKKASPDLFRRYQEEAEGLIRYVTIAPEAEGAAELVPALRELGMTVALGHSGATYDQTMACIQAGARAATHTANAMRLFHQHEPAIFGAVLESDVWCEMICDGRHLHPGSVRLILKTKGLDRAVAITDSIMAAGLPDGRYRLGVNDVVVINGDAKLPDTGVRAGSTLTMIQALRNLLQFTGLPLESVSRLLCTNQAALMGWENRGRIAPGMEADLVLLDRDLQVCRTIAAGETVYVRPSV